jgi:hypothetical protein
MPMLMPSSRLSEAVAPRYDAPSQVEKGRVCEIYPEGPLGSDLALELDIPPSKYEGSVAQCLSQVCRQLMPMDGHGRLDQS